MTRAFTYVDLWIGRITASLLALALMLAFYGLVERNLLSGSGIDWIIEVVIFLVVWALLLALARVEHRRAHIRMTVVWTVLGDRAKAAAEILGLLVGLFVSCFFVVSGLIVVAEAIAWDERTDSLLRLPYWVYYSALSVSFAVHALFAAQRLVTTLRVGPDFTSTDLTSG